MDDETKVIEQVICSEAEICRKDCPHRVAHVAMVTSVVHDVVTYCDTLERCRTAGIDVCCEVV